jgi:hypothetical protein
MAFSATLRVRSTAGVAVAAWVREESEVAEEDLGEVGDGVEGPAAVGCSAMFHCSGGTCHVARCYDAMMVAPDYTATNNTWKTRPQRQVR